MRLIKLIKESPILRKIVFFYEKITWF